MQAEQLAEQIMRQIDQAAMLYHRLILVVATAGGGKRECFRNLPRGADSAIST